MTGSCPDGVYGFEAVSIDGRPVALASFRGDVLLIVNVASRCGFTPQYRGLEALHRRHRADGFAVLGFPCDQFGHQEPGAEDEILRFCAQSYDITFPLFAKVDVNGPSAHPLFGYLTSAQTGWLGSASIKWNFTKFLVDRHGRAVRRFAPSHSPEALAPEVAEALRQPRPDRDAR
jgi:glutathione peroxidase